MFFTMRVIFTVSVLLFVSACVSPTKNAEIDLSYYLAQTQVEQGASAVAVSKPSHVLPGDVIQVRFPFKPELNSAYQVGVDGHISVLYLGSISVVGKSLPEIEERIRTEYNQLAFDEANIPVEEKEYRIQPGDVLDIRFSYKPELDETIIVRPDGRISLPLLNSIVAENKTPESLSEQLQIEFAKVVNKPELVVIVKEFSRKQFYSNGRLVRDQFQDLRDPIITLGQRAQRYIYVGGEVNRPGVIPINGPLTVLQAILMSGGNKKTALMKQVAIIRKPATGEGSSSLIVRNLHSESLDEENDKNQILNAAVSDIQLQANDIVILPKTSVSKVEDFLNQYVYGLIPILRNSSLGFAYALNPVDEIRTTNTDIIIPTISQ